MAVQLAIAGFALLLSYHLLKSSLSTKKIKLPRVGPPTPLGYIWTVWRSVFHQQKLFVEGREKFGGRPFVVPTLAGPLVVIGPENVEFLQQSDDSVFSQPAALSSALTFPQTVDPHQFVNPYQATIVKTDVTRALPSLIPEVLDEMKLVMEENLKMTDGSDTVTLPVLFTMTQIAGRMASRALVGPPLCHDPNYIRTMVHYSRTVSLFSKVIRWCPNLLRDAFYLLLQSIFGGKKQALQFLLPFVTDYIQKRETMDVKPPTMTEFLVRAAPADDLANPLRIAGRLLNLSFASIHTTSLMATINLFQLAVLPQSEQDEIRAEIQQTLDEEGGWNKAALARCRKLDSLLKETGRTRPFSLLAVSRKAVQDGTLPDGTLVPAGYTMCIDIERVHSDPKTYPEPEIFDPFRFSNLGKEAESDPKNAYTTVNKTFLAFGIGRHACPGRFFAAMEIKLIISYLLLNYNFEFPGGVKAMPENFTFEALIAPNPKAVMVFRKRAGTAG